VTPPIPAEGGREPPRTRPAPASLLPTPPSERHTHHRLAPENGKKKPLSRWAQGLTLRLGKDYTALAKVASEPRRSWRAPLKLGGVFWFQGVSRNVPHKQSVDKSARTNARKEKGP